MPRSKRSVRAAGVAKTLTGQSSNPLIRCLCCGRWLPREAIAEIQRKPFVVGGKEMPRAFCGECYHSGAVWREAWVVELEAKG
jgi:hypothetical protein